MPKLLLLGDGFTSESRRLFQAMTTPASAARKRVIDTMIRALKSTNVWNSLDVLYVLAAETSQAARLNWKNPGTFTLSLVNSPTFLADRGYTGDGATSYLTGPNPATFGGNYSLNSAHMGVWIGTNVVELLDDIGNTQVRIRSQNTANTPLWRVNDGTNTNSINVGSNSIGHSISSRNLSTAYDVYKNGVNKGTPAVTSTAITSGVIGLCALGNGSGFSTKRVQAGHIGPGLTAQQISDLYNALSAYMTTVGA